MAELVEFLEWVVIGGTVVSWTIAANWWGMYRVYGWLTCALKKKEESHG